MATNLNVERMALNRDAAIEFVVPELPEFPTREPGESGTGFNNKIIHWNERMKLWRNQLQTQLKAQILSLKTGD